MSKRVPPALLVLVLATACAVVEVFYLPLRVNSVLVPVAVLAAAIGNVVFTRLMYAVTGSILAALFPALAWLAVIARAATARPEGDLLITDGGGSTGSVLVNLGFFLVGAGAGAYAVGTLRRPTRRQGTLRAAAADQPPDTAGRT